MKATEKAVAALETAIRARVPLIGVETTEEDRVTKYVRQIADYPMMSLTDEERITTDERLVFEWTHTGGLVLVRPKYRDADNNMAPMPDSLATRYDEAEAFMAARSKKATNQPYAAAQIFCEWARAELDDGGLDEDLMREHAAVLVMHDLHRFLGASEGKGDPASIRSLRDLFYGLLPTKSFCVITAPDMSSLGDSGTEIVVIRWPLPDTDELTAMVRATARRVNIPVNDDVMNGGAEVLGQALAALTWTQAGFVLRQAMVMAKELSAEACGPIISAMKAQILKQQQGIELIEPEPLDHIGGLDMLKAAVAHYPKLLTKAARDANVRPPRAILMMGPAGTGKSLACKCLGGGLLPILRWSPAESKNMYVGNTAANTRAVLNAADAIDLCVLWIDELDLVFADGADQHEVSKEQQQQLLTWMQERKSSCIVVATTNHPDRLPAPLRDRFEDRWLVDLPRNTAEARQVFEIHLRKRDLAHLAMHADLDKVAAETVRSSINPRGIEQAIEAAHRLAWSADQELTIELLYNQILTRSQMTRHAAEAIQDMRAKALQWAMPASSAQPDQVGRAVPGQGKIDL